MPVTTVTTRTTTSASGIAVHTISFRGLAGAIFVCLAVASILYVIGFATTEWAIYGSTHEGLWESCTCSNYGTKPDWFKAFQAMITIGLIGLLLSMVLACVYLCVHSISKNTTILLLVIVCFLTVIFMLIGFIIYGHKREDNVNWSFAICVVSAVFTLIAGILAIVQMRKAGVRV